MMLSVARLYSVELCDSGKDSEGRSHGLIEVLFWLLPVENEEHVRKYVVQKEGHGKKLGMWSFGKIDRDGNVRGRWKR